MKVIANRNLSSTSGAFEDKIKGETFEIKDKELCERLIKDGDVFTIEKEINEKPVK